MRLSSYSEWDNSDIEGTRIEVGNYGVCSKRLTLNHDNCGNLTAIITSNQLMRKNNIDRSHMGYLSHLNTITLYLISIKKADVLFGHIRRITG